MVAEAKVKRLERQAENQSVGKSSMKEDVTGELQEVLVMEHFKERSADLELREEVAGLFCAQRSRSEHSTLTLCPLSDKEESINSAIEEHLIAVTEQEEFDEETESLRPELW